MFWELDLKAFSLSNKKPLFTLFYFINWEGDFVIRLLTTVAVNLILFSPPQKSSGIAAKLADSTAQTAVLLIQQKLRKTHRAQRSGRTPSPKFPNPISDSDSVCIPFIIDIHGKLNPTASLSFSLSINHNQQELQ